MSETPPPDEEVAGGTPHAAGITTSEMITRLAALFAGGDHAHTVGRPTDKIDERGKVQVAYTTRWRPISEADWRRHLSGIAYLTPVAIWRDNTVRFGGIDIDLYSLDRTVLAGNIALAAQKIAATKLPLILCRSKSGCPRLFLFLAEPVSAAVVRSTLTDWCVALGYEPKEIFPKQEKLGANDAGTGINAPYFDHMRADQCAIGDDGAVLSLAEFLDRAEAARVSAAQLAAIHPAMSFDTEDGPEAEGKGKARKARRAKPNGNEHEAKGGRDHEANTGAGADHDTDDDDDDDDDADRPKIPIEDIVAVLRAIPNGGPKNWDWWNGVAMAVWRETHGSAEGCAAFTAWSAKNPTHADDACRECWRRITASPPTRTGMAKLVALARSGFPRNAARQIVATSRKNIQLALARMGVTVSHDIFADRLLFQRDDNPPTLPDDAALDRLWIDIDTVFRFRPPPPFFRTIVVDAGRRAGFHPVRIYLDGLVWDRTPRIDRWLITYGGAADSAYCRAVAPLVLIAGVRRVRKPGCKFDEMLVLESPQGTNKSSALAALCPDAAWFSDDLPLNVSAKEVIERTTGKWIIEAAELSGMRKADIEHIKATLSRQVDTARLAYGRLTVERPRSFILIGTTNSDAYLKDSTGNRRFLPVRTPIFDLAGIRRDRDQLWAEAAYREAQGESIRLPEALWPDAGVQQERRRVQDPWESTLAERLGEMQGKLLCQDAWHLVGMHDPARRDQQHNARLGEAMKQIGFTREKQRRGRKSKDTKDIIAWHYVRGAKGQPIEVQLTYDDHGRVTGCTVHQDKM